MKFKTLAPVSLGFFPTPLEPLAFLSSQFGLKVLLKRDDLTGLALGGNKTRKLEYLMADALAQGSDCVITAGASQSNHCRQTAAAAAKLGLDCHLLLGGTEPDSYQGNLLLDKLFSATLHFSGQNRKGEAIAELEQQLIEQGRKPYVIPYGGSNNIGALGFVKALYELNEQESGVTHIVIASSSGGTHAGLEVAKRLLELDVEIIGIAIDKAQNSPNEFVTQITNIANATATLLNVETPFQASDFSLRTEFYQTGYGVLSEADKHAINVLAKNMGVLLDPVYSGRAFAGLLGLLQQGYFKPSDKVVFWHTGGAPAIFAYSEQLS